MYIWVLSSVLFKFRLPNKEHRNQVEIFDQNTIICIVNKSVATPNYKYLDISILSIVGLYMIVVNVVKYLVSVCDGELLSETFILFCDRNSMLLIHC